MPEFEGTNLDNNPLARAFKEGIKLLPKILEVAPYILKKFDDELTQEAAERVESRLKEKGAAGEKTEEGKNEQKPEEMAEIPDEGKVETKEEKTPSLEQDLSNEPGIGGETPKE